MNEEVIW